MQRVKNNYLCFFREFSVLTWVTCPFLGYLKKGIDILNCNQTFQMFIYD